MKISFFASPLGGAIARNLGSGEVSEGREAQYSRSGDRRYEALKTVRNAGSSLFPNPCSLIPNPCFFTPR